MIKCRLKSQQFNILYYRTEVIFCWKFPVEFGDLSNPGYIVRFPCLVLHYTVLLVWSLNDTLHACSQTSAPLMYSVRGSTMHREQSSSAVVAGAMPTICSLRPPSSPLLSSPLHACTHTTHHTSSASCCYCALPWSAACPGPAPSPS